MKEFTLLIIKQNNKFLMKYDKSWDMYMLPYFKSDISYEDIKKSLSNEFNIDIKDIELNLYGQNEVTKASKYDNKERHYKHTFVEVDIRDNIIIPNEYKFMSLNELKTDKNTVIYNYDVLNMLISYDMC